MSSEHFHTVVVGGGIAGLACAHRLARELGRDRVRLLEASDYLGGYVRTTHEQGYQLDWGPNGFLDREPKVLEWIRELGLEGELVQANQAAAKRFLLLKGTLLELIGPPKFFTSRLLSVPGKLRLMMEPLIPAKRDDSPESIFDFAARRIGREAAETLASAMVLGIFGGDAKQLSLQHCFPRMAAMEREHGGLFRAMLAKKKSGGGGSPVGGTLTSLRGGIGRLAERLREVLGGVAQTETKVTGIEKTGEGFVVHCGHAGARPSQVRCEKLVLAVPAYVAAELMENLSPGTSTHLKSVRYTSLVVLCTGIRDPKFYMKLPQSSGSTIGYGAGFRHEKAKVLHGFGYLVPPREGLQTLGCLWTSTIFPESMPPGCLLLRTMIGGALHPEVIDLSDQEIVDIFRRDVLGPLALDGNCELTRVIRHRQAIPQYGLNHGEVLGAVDQAELAHPGLYFTGSAFRGVAVIDCVADAFSVAERVLAR